MRIDHPAFDFLKPPMQCIIECGAHKGIDTLRLLQRAKPSRYYAFEPDPRNLVALKQAVEGWPAVVVDKAVGDVSGSRPWHSASNDQSSSYLAPKRHITAWPDITFSRGIEVDVIRLDDFAERHDIEFVDLWWADVQGATKQMLAGGAKLLNRTKYFYVEVGSQEFYEGEPDLNEICTLLGPRWQVKSLFTEDCMGVEIMDALFRNTEVV